MNKTMILAILVAYKAFNDKSLTVVTDEYVVNFAVIDTIDNDTVSLLSYANDDNYGRITININDIIGIQFTDKAAVVGMKWYSNVATWNDEDKSVAESTPPTTLLSYHYSYISSFKYYYLCFNS